MNTKSSWPIALALACVFVGCAPQDMVGPRLSSPRSEVVYPSGMLCAGGFHTCALHQKGFGTSYCWGSNKSGQWGNGALSIDPVVTKKGGLSHFSDAVQVSCGYDHTCVVSAGGRLACFGDNAKGQIGNNSRGGTVPDPFGRL